MQVVAHNFALDLSAWLNRRISAIIRLCALDGENWYDKRGAGNHQGPA
jgi:hypothetical protein